MKFTGSDAAFNHLRAWLANEPWRQRWQDVISAHLPEDLVARLARTGRANDINQGLWAQWEGFALEDLMSMRFGEPGENLVDAYLARRGWRETGQAKLYFRAIRDARPSLFEVVDRDPGVSMILRDLVGDQPPVTVLEKLGSLSCKQWDRVVARVVVAGGRSYLTGALIRFDFDAADRLLACLTHHKAIAFIPGKGPPLFARTWLEYWTERLEHPPRAVDAEGDDLAFVELRFALPDVAADAAAMRLDAAADFAREGHGEPCWSWFATGPAAPAAAAASERVLSIASMNPEGRRIRGTIRLDAGALFLEAKSVRSSQDGANRLHALLGELIGPSETNVTSLSDLHEQRSTEQSSDLAPSIPPDEKRRIVRAYMDQHYLNVLDDKVPSLGGRTPRQCARSKKYRHLVVDWLKLIENSHAHGGGEAGNYDASWLWEELGLERERTMQRES